MESVLCVGCSAVLSKDQPVYPIRQYVKIRRRTRTVPGYACRTCGSSEIASPSWSRIGALAGGWGDLPPAPCESCGQMVILTDDPRRKRVTCSPRCAVAVTPSHQQPPTPARSCAGCGTDLDGRADRAYCRPACRQKAYRNRARV